MTESVLNAEQEQLRQTVAAFARDVVAPVSAHHDATLVLWV